MTTAINQWEGQTRWKDSIICGVLAWGLSVFMAAPPFSAWTWSNIVASRAGDFLKQCAHPLTRDLVEPILAYRVATPFIAWVLHLPSLAALGLSYLFSVATLIGIHRVMRKKLEAESAAALTIALGCSATIFYPNWMLGMPDSLTHLCTVVALVAGPVTATLTIGVGWLNDERMALALPFIALWRWEESVGQADGWRPRAFRSLAPLLAGTFLAFAIRCALAEGWIGPGIPRPTLYGKIFASIGHGQPWLGSWGVYLINLALGPRWLWLAVALPWVYVGSRPNKIMAILHCLAFVGTCASALLVSDVARTVGFAFPAVLIAAHWFARNDPSRARRLFVGICALQVATPALWVYERWQWLQFRPFPWELKLWLRI